MNSDFSRLEKYIKESEEETRRHFDIVAEDLMSSMRQIAEGVSTNSDLIERLTSRINSVEEQIDQLQGMRASIETMREDIGQIRSDIAGINGKLSKTPSYEDLAAIEKRVWRLEQKLQS